MLCFVSRDMGSVKGPFSCLSEETINFAKTLALEISKVPLVNSRIQDLKTDKNSCRRSVVVLKKGVKAGIHDVEKYVDILRVLVDLDVDSEANGYVFMDLVVHNLDNWNSNKLSGQKECLLRLKWAETESSRLRLVWSYFRRQLMRSNFSNNNEVLRLKSHWIAKLHARGRQPPSEMKRSLSTSS